MTKDERNRLLLKKALASEREGTRPHLAPPLKHERQGGVVPFGVVWQWEEDWQKKYPPSGPDAIREKYRFLRLPYCVDAWWSDFRDWEIVTVWERILAVSYETAGNRCLMSDLDPAEEV